MLLLDMPTMCDRGPEWSIMLDNATCSHYQSRVMHTGKYKEYVDPQGLRWMAYDDRVHSEIDDSDADTVATDDVPPNSEDNPVPADEQPPRRKRLMVQCRIDNNIG